MASLETQAIFKTLTAKPCNQKCVDCGMTNPQWASAKFGCYFCLSCSGHHRGLGVHIDFVRSVYMDSWKDIELKHMSLGGNDKLLEYMRGKGVADMPIDKKYTSHALLLYKEQLACKASGRPYREGEALKQIIAMENRAKDRERERSISSSSMGSTPAPRHGSTGNTNRALETAAQLTSGVFSRAVSSTSSISNAMQDQWQTSPQCSDILGNATSALSNLNLGQTAGAWGSTLKSWTSNATTAISESINSARAGNVEESNETGGDGAQDDLSDLLGGSSGARTSSSGAGGGTSGKASLDDLLGGGGGGADDSRRDSDKGLNDLLGTTTSGGGGGGDVNKGLDDLLGTSGGEGGEDVNKGLDDLLGGSGSGERGAASDLSDLFGKPAETTAPDPSAWASAPATSSSSNGAMLAWSDELVAADPTPSRVAPQSTHNAAPAAAENPKADTTWAEADDWGDDTWASNTAAPASSAAAPVTPAPSTNAPAVAAGGAEKSAEANTDWAWSENW